MATKKIKVFVLCETSAPIAQIFGDNFEITLHKEEAEVVLLRSELFIFDQFPQCVAAIRLGKNTDNIDPTEAEKRNILVFYADTGNSNSVAQLVQIEAGMVLRKLPTAFEFTKHLPLDDDSVTKLEKQKRPFLGRTFNEDLTVGVIGYGAIGKIVTQIMQFFNVKVYINDLPKVLNAVEDTRLIKAYSVEDMLEYCDVITAHTPGKEAVISREMFSQVKENSIFLDFARGGAYSLTGVRQQIEKKNISIINDFCNDPWLALQKDFPLNVHMSPHVAALTYEAEYKCAKVGITAFKNWQEKGELSPTTCKNPHVMQSVG